jgi:hypothetical protein
MQSGQELFVTKETREDSRSLTEETVQVKQRTKNPFNYVFKSEDENIGKSLFYRNIFLDSMYSLRMVYRINK